MKKISTITNNEDDIRFKIYEGEFTPNEAYQKLLELEQSQRRSDNIFNQYRIDALLEVIEKYEKKENTGSTGSDVSGDVEIVIS